MGSPAVPAERLSASESLLALETMMEYNGHESFDAMIGIEIGGSNGLQPLTIGSSQNFNVPTVDADWMGTYKPVTHPILSGGESTNYELQKAGHFQTCGRSP